MNLGLKFLKQKLKIASKETFNLTFSQTCKYYMVKSVGMSL